MRLSSILDKTNNSSIVIKNTAVSVCVKGVSLFVAFLTTPAYMHYFGSESVLGVWFTVLSVLAWILNCDMGIGNGLRNHLVYAIHENDWEKARKLISSAYIFLCSAGAVILAVVLFIGRVLDWNRIFNVSTSIIGHRTMGQVMNVLLASIILQFILRLVTSILYALQEAFVPSLLSLITNVVLLGYVCLANVSGTNDNILLLASVYLLAVNIPLLLATIWVFWFKLPYSRPSYRFYNKGYASIILQVGSKFLWLQLVAMVVDNTNNYLIALFVGNVAVVEYQLYNRIFFLPVTMLMVFTTSIWSTITKAKAENNLAWIKSSYKKSLLILGIMTIVELVIIPVLQPIFDIWLGGKTIPVNYGAAAVIAIASIVMGMRTILSGYSNGLCELKIQIIYMTAGAAVNIPVAYFLSEVYESYLAVVIANIISMIPFCVAQLRWCHRNIMQINK